MTVIVAMILPLFNAFLSNWIIGTIVLFSPYLTLRPQRLERSGRFKQSVPSCNPCQKTKNVNMQRTFIFKKNSPTLMNTPVQDFSP